MTKRLLYMLERLHEKTRRAEQIHSERDYLASLHARDESDRELASILDAVNRQLDDLIADTRDAVDAKESSTAGGR